jgi:hypothetical protein
VEKRKQFVTSQSRFVLLNFIITNTSGDSITCRAYKKTDIRCVVLFPLETLCNRKLGKQKFFVVSGFRILISDTIGHAWKSILIAV